MIAWRRGAIALSLVSDPNSTVIDRYGLSDPEYAKEKLNGVLQPAVFMRDEQGRVRWEKIESDYRVCPTNKETALDAFQ